MFIRGPSDYTIRLTEEHRARPNCCLRSLRRGVRDLIAAQAAEGTGPIT